VYTQPSSDERDQMQGNRNCVNPIIKFSDSANFVVFGQKTLQRLPTALDRVNVRRMLLYVEKLIRRRARRILFDPHDDILRSQFVQIATDVLNQVRKDRGLNDFFVKCDAELNPSDVVDRNEMRAKIGVQPERAAEFMFIEFSVHRTGSFTENANTF
jgi:phage tail sheath protein FI